MAGRLRAVSDQDKPADPVTDSKGAALISEALEEVAGRMPVGSDVRALALRDADRWHTLAGIADPIRLENPP